MVVSTEDENSESENTEENFETISEVQNEIDTTENTSKENTETISEEKEQEEITCYPPVISFENLQTEEKEKKFSEKEIFEEITENQYQLFNMTSENEEKKAEEKTEEDIIEKNIIEETEIIDEEPEIVSEEITQETYEPKTVTINYDNTMGKFETALEIRYSSLKLTSFPVKISNIPAGMTFPDELVIGNASIKVGDETVNNCYLKIASNESVKMFEIKHREFKLGLSVTLNNDTINSYGNVRYYEISSLIKNSRMLKVLEMFGNIFSGTPVTFKVNKLYGNIIAEDTVENIKIKTIQNFFDTLEKAGYKFQADKLPESSNVYYLLELCSALKENKKIETWCNFNLNTENINLHEGDSLIVKRIHNFDKHSAVEETVILKAPLNEQNIFTKKAAGYRKQCIIELKKISK